MTQLPKSGGSYTCDKDGRNLKQVQKPTADHPKGNRARKAEQSTQPAQQIQSTTDSKSLKEKPNAAV